MPLETIQPLLSLHTALSNLQTTFHALLALFFLEDPNMECSVPGDERFQMLVKVDSTTGKRVGERRPLKYLLMCDARTLLLKVRDEYLEMLLWLLLLWLLWLLWLCCNAAMLPFWTKNGFVTVVFRSFIDTCSHSLTHPPTTPIFFRLLSSSFFFSPLLSPQRTAAVAQLSYTVRLMAADLGNPEGSKRGGGPSTGGEEGGGGGRNATAGYFAGT